MLRQCLLLSIVALALFVISVILHNAISAWFGVEEPFFLLLAVVVAPVALLIGVVGSLVAAIAGMGRGRHAPQ